MTTVIPPRSFTVTNPTCLTCRTPKYSQPPTFSQDQVQITKATSLLNAGVPLHVVQRYMGHLSPAMTMEYAETLAATHEREFLRYRKITADARELPGDPREVYDMLQLDQRTDRILPNGWCLLPPRQLCQKGNACLTCDKFATDATFLPELKTQQTRTGQLGDYRSSRPSRPSRPSAR